GVKPEDVDSGTTPRPSGAGRLERLLDAADDDRPRKTRHLPGGSLPVTSRFAFRIARTRIDSFRKTWLDEPSTGAKKPFLLGWIVSGPSRGSGRSSATARPPNIVRGGAVSNASW